MSNFKRCLIRGAMVFLWLLSGWYTSILPGGTEARVFAATTPAPDLVIESLAFSPESSSIGDTVTFSVTIKNQGELSAGISQLTCSIDGTNLATTLVDTIGYSAVETRTFTWKAQAGPHTFRAIIDSDNSIDEAIENNNDRTLAFSILAPDLAIDSISWTPLNPVTGDKVTFTVKVINQGDKRAGISFIDLSIDGSSRSPQSNLGIEGGASANMTFIWIAVPGVHIIRAAADVLNQVIEGDETNNGSETICATSLPDLIINSITMSPASPVEGDNVTMTVNIKNQGSSLAEPSTVTYYIDDDQRYSDFLGQLSPGAVTATSFTCVAGNKPQTFKAVVDADNRIKELIKTNNTGVIIFPLLFPDLIIQDITWTPSSPLLHDFVSVTVTVKNQGKNTSGATELKFSIDSAYFFNAMIPELSAGSTTTAIFNWMTQNYTHTVKATIDEVNLIKESNETNNSMTKTVISYKPTPTADLVIEKSTYSPAKPVMGETIALTLGVKNQGVGKASPSYAAIYIDGKLMDEIYINELEAGTPVTKDITIPLQGLPFKDKYVMRVYLDNHYTVFETNELNNEKEISFSTIAPDLVIQGIRWSPESPVTGDRVTFDVTVKNQGDLKSGSSYISYYVDEVFMGRHRFEDIEPGTTVTRSFMFATQHSSFAFTAMVDEDGEIAEKNESNNSGTVTLPAPDLLIDSITWSPENPLEIIPVTFTASIRNRGSGRSAGTHLSCYFDGATPILQDISEISPGGTTTVVFIYSFAPGEHALKLVTDASDTMAESDEANNEKTIKFVIQPRSSSVPGASANSSIIKNAEKALTPTPTVKTPQTPTLQTPAPEPIKAVSTNITASPPKWQSIIQSKWFIIGFGVVGVGAIGVLLLLRKKASKKAETE